MLHVATIKAFCVNMAVGRAGQPASRVGERSTLAAYATDRFKNTLICNLWFHILKPECGITTNFFIHKILSLRADRSGETTNKMRVEEVLTAMWKL